MENYHFAIFNVADMAITGGAILLVFLSLFASDQID
jgi:signal peptidase II